MKKSELIEQLKDTADDADIDDILPVKEVIKEVEKEKSPTLYTFTPEQFTALCESAFKQSIKKEEGGSHDGEVFI